MLISELKYHTAKTNTNLSSLSGGQLDFHLPPELEASEPPEARGLARDEVRLMVSTLANNRVRHTRFRSLPDYLAPDDLLVINTSGTLNAALNATRADGTPLQLHLSTRLPADLWSVEVRQPDGLTSRPFANAVAGETLVLPAGASATLHTPYRPDQRSGGPTRLWIATLLLPDSLSLEAYLGEHGHPIRYYYVPQAWHWFS